MHVQGRDNAKTGFPIDNYEFINLEDRTLIIVKNNVFHHVMDHVLLKARQFFPDNFGTGNAITVLHALQKVNPVFPSLKREISFLKNENFGLCCEYKDGIFNERVLRLDLFRKLDAIPNKKRKYEFTGGIFHAMKHFSFNNLPLGTGTEINNVHRPISIARTLACAFFLNPIYFSKKYNSHVAFVDYSLNSFLQCSFYQEKEPNVYFLKTVHPFRKKNLNKWILKNSI